ncbi:MAG TPA: hypothetical protein VHZ95_07290 [Polyangiales bacterium]|nr:hypothetical protein [Polyangiales bacterium]
MSRRAGRQLFFLAAALAIWSALGRADLLWLVAAYLAVLIAWELPAMRRALEPLRLSQWLWLSLLLATPALVWGYRMRGQLGEREGWTGMSARLFDRVRLESTPSIAPPLVSADRPQTFFIEAPNARAVQVTFGSKARTLAAEALGGGLFRVEYDPRRDGALSPSDGELSAALRVDGRDQVRTMRSVTPLAHPRWFCTSPNGRIAATPSEETDELIVIDSERRSRRLAVGDGPIDCAFANDRTLLVSQRFDGQLVEFDLAGSRPARSLSLGVGLGRIALSPDRSRLVVARRDELVVVSWPEWQVQARLPLMAADQIAFGPDRDTLIVATRNDAALHRYQREGEAYRESAMLRLGRPAVALGRSRDGSHLWIATTDYRPDGSKQLGNHFVQDQILTVDVASFRVIEQRLTARRSERQSRAGDVDRGVSPMDLLELRDGRLAVAFAGTDEVELFGHSPEPTLIDLGENGLHALHGLAELADGTLLVSSPVVGAIGVLSPGDPRARTLRFEPDDASLLHANPNALERRIGERGFYESTRAGVSCQSCHIHADSDDAGYNLGDHRLVPTLSVRGLLDTAPYLRDGSYPRLRDLDDVAQQRYRGYLRDQPGRRQTLEAYVESLPRDNVRTAARDPSAERRGYAAFRKAHCDRCHAPPAFTNLALLPLAALFPNVARAQPAGEMVDVPSLLSLASSAPYLNDGRARTIEAVLIDHNKDNLHGDVRTLSQPERRDLIAFLSSL